MQKLILTGLLLALSLAAHASYPYFVFVTTEGIEHGIPSTGLEISFDDDVMTARSGTDIIELSTVAISSMRFSATMSGVSAGPASEDCALSAYTLQGVSIGTYSTLAEAIQNLETGIYILRDAKGSTLKLSVSHE